jgi:Tol biopolymer transport system component
VKVIADAVVTEDAHRAALQQWAAGGRRVAYHNVLPGDEWVVAGVDVASGEQRVLARRRQLGIGHPALDVVPIYSPHWDPGDFRDLELLNVVTGEVSRTSLTADATRKAYPELVGKLFGEKPISVFFPVLSPDGSRVFFKLATPAGGNFRTKQASTREGIVGYDLKAGRFLFMQSSWGHPAWHPDSRHILNVGGYVTDSDTGKRTRIPNPPNLPGSHPSYGPAGRLFASDAGGVPFGKPANWWVTGVGDVATGEFVVLHAADNSKGAKSWRPTHPHPVFSADGRRLYFNLSADGQTRLHVAEAKV